MDCRFSIVDFIRPSRGPPQADFRFAATLGMLFKDPRRTLGLNEFEALRFVFLFWIRRFRGNDTGEGDGKGRPYGLLGK